MDDDYSWTWQAWLEAFQIFAKYSKSRLLGLGAEHDIIYCWAKEKVSDEDAATLEKCGWVYDESIPAWTLDV